MPEEAREAAKELLESADLIRAWCRTSRRSGLRRGRTGALLYLTGSSRRLQKPMAVMVQGRSSTGKSIVDENSRVCSLRKP